jgi:hypothetical protein
VKLTNFLVSEHSDVQSARKGKSFMDTMTVTRTYIMVVLECETTKYLYEYGRVG